MKLGSQHWTLKSNYSNGAASLELAKEPGTHTSLGVLFNRIGLKPRPTFGLSPPQWEAADAEIKSPTW